MLVVDASAVAELLMASPIGSEVREFAFSSREPLAAPQLLDIEVLHAFRRFHRTGLVSLERSDQALEDLADLAITRYGHELLRSGIWRLRNNVTAYDAAYIVLAELLDAPILTCDGKLARSSGHGVRFRLFEPSGS